ncbi:MAG: tetratricopeptide repeat protein [Proteobacteria bacterium]|nr:tetratricopeptide repeat protein [Pseudomonadota bacterium]
MAAPARAAGSPWLHGPVSDLLLGGGLIYIPILLVLLFAGAQIQSALSLSLMPLVALAFSTPHLGATLLRVYERVEDRRAYRLFAFHATVLIAALFGVGLYHSLVGSILITLYLTVVPWHFTGQNYGIALMSLRRRGVEITPDVKRLIYASFVLTYVMTLLALHGRTLTDAYAPLETAGTIYTFLTLGIPPEVQGPAILLAAGAYLWTLWAAASRLLRHAPLSDLWPAATLVLTQALWYSVPILLLMLAPTDRLGPLSPANFGFTFLWVSMCHGLQYLWITTYYARRQNPPTPPTRFLLKALLTGAAIYGFPILLFAPGVLGRLPYDSGLFLMIAGALNVHHVLLDSAIWKLRDGRIAQILIRGTAESSKDSSARPRARASRSWVRPLVWASGIVGVVLTVAGSLEMEFGYVRAMERGDLARMEVAAQRLTWMGRDSSRLRAAIGTYKAEQGDAFGAIAQLQRSVDLEPNAVALINLGVIQERAGEVEDALASYERALEVDGANVDALFYAGRASLKAGQPERAQQLLRRAARLSPERPEILRALRRARQRGAVPQA